MNRAPTPLRQPRRHVHRALAHCYTPRCTPGPSPYVYKRKVQGPRKKVAARENGLTRSLTPSLSLSLANACNPLLQAHPPWAQDNTRPRVPLTIFPPLVSPSRVDPSGLGHAGTIYSSVQGPPGSKRRQFQSKFRESSIFISFLSLLKVFSSSRLVKISANWFGY
jgi:hypothetical protein